MQYDIFRDLITIVIGVTAVLGAIIGGLLFFVLRAALIKDIMGEVNKQIDKTCRKLAGQTDSQAGITYWVAKMYDQAINVTKRALTDAEDVLDKSQVIFAKSNLGFYYAEKHRVQQSFELKEEAIALTKIGFEEYSSTKVALRQPDWIDNYVFTKVTFVETKSERIEIIELINKLLLRADLARIHNYLEDSKKFVQGQKITS